MRSKKWILILPLSILAIVIVGCAGEEVTINDTYAITVCQKTDNAVVSAEGIEYETGQNAINGKILKRGKVFEVFTTHFILDEAKDKYVINRVIKEVRDTPEPCP